MDGWDGIGLDNDWIYSWNMMMKWGIEIGKPWRLEAEACLMW